MRRSKIDELIYESATFLTRMGISLPPQAYWNLKTWHEHRDSAEEMRIRGIGWDLTDFGSGNFHEIGLLLYTFSNGIIDPKTEVPLDQPYAQKLLVAREGQITPTHHHWRKMEDIIVLAGGNLDIKLNNVSPNNDELDTDTEVRIMKNNAWEVYAPDTVLSLAPGERVRLEQHHYHKFWSRQGTVAIEEVSTVNDDEADNCFLPEDKVARFPEVEEDQEPKYLLSIELPGAEKFEQLAKMYL